MKNYKNGTQKKKALSVHKKGYKDNATTFMFKRTKRTKKTLSILDVLDVHLIRSIYKPKNQKST